MGFWSDDVTVRLRFRCDDVTVRLRFRCDDVTVTQIPLRWCHSATQIPLAMMSQCDSDSAAMMSQCDSDSAAMMSQWTQIPLRWCHSATQIPLAMMSQCDSDSAAMMSQCDSDSAAMMSQCDSDSAAMMSQWTQIPLRWCHSATQIPLRWCHSATQIPLRWCHSATQIPLRWCHSGLRFRCDDVTVRLRFRWRWCHSATQIPLVMMSQCDSDSAGDDVTMWLRFRWWWCHSATQIPLWWCHSATQIPLAMMSQCDSDSAAMMSCSDLDSGSSSGTVYIFRLLFLPLHSADEIHSASLSLSLSVCLSLSRLCLAVCVYHGFTVSHFQIRTNTITHSTHGRQSKAPCSERSNKTGAQTDLSWVMRLHTHTNSQKQCLLFTHTLTCDSLIKSDQIHLPFRKAVRVFPRVRAEIRTSQDNRHKTQQITEHVPVQISHIFLSFQRIDGQWTIKQIYRFLFLAIHASNRKVHRADRALWSLLFIFLAYTDLNQITVEGCYRHKWLQIEE